MWNVWTSSTPCQVNECKNCPYIDNPKPVHYLASSLIMTWLPCFIGWRHLTVVWWCYSCRVTMKTKSSTSPLNWSVSHYTTIKIYHCFFFQTLMLDNRLKYCTVKNLKNDDRQALNVKWWCKGEHNKQDYPIVNNTVLSCIREWSL